MRNDISQFCNLEVVIGGFPTKHGIIIITGASFYLKILVEKWLSWESTYQCEDQSSGPFIHVKDNSGAVCPIIQQWRLPGAAG